MNVISSETRIMKKLSKRDIGNWFEQIVDGQNINFFQECINDYPFLTYENKKNLYINVDDFMSVLESLSKKQEKAIDKYIFSK